MSAEPRDPRPLAEECPSGYGIAGVETSTAGFIGAYDDPGGVPAGEVIECASLADFQAAFGEAATEGGAANLAGAVAGFFANGGRRCYAVREDDAVAVAASALEKLAAIDDVALVAAPAIADAAVLSAIAAHCSEHVRFAIFDTPEDGPADPLEPTAYGAIYFPWLEVEDPLADPGGTRFVPPSGHVAGVLARVDASRGVDATPGGQPGRRSGRPEARGRRRAGEQPQRGEGQLPAQDRGRHRRLGGAHAERRPRVEVPQRPAAVHLPRGLDREGHAVGGV